MEETVNFKKSWIKEHVKSMTFFSAAALCYRKVGLDH